jgi:hypothetical protein
MTQQEIKAYAPAVLTTRMAPTLFDSHYEHVSSWKVIESLLNNGFGISRVQQLEDRHGDSMMREFSKHIVCLRPLDAFEELHAGQYIPEIVYRAAHDGSSAIHMSLGVYRVICKNGMMVSENEWSAVRIPHQKGAEVKALAAAKDLYDRVPSVERLIKSMTNRELRPYEQRRLATRGLELRFGDKAPAYDPGVLLMQRRLEDAGANLWNVLNRIQENVMKGGFESAPGPKGKSVTLPEIKSIGGDVSINQGLWASAEEMLTA